MTIVAHGTASLSIAELTDVRQHSIDRFSAQLRPSLLKHSDEQTLAALVALDRALGQIEPCESFGDWAIVSATRYLGRTAFAAVIDKYKIDGAWGVSVQVIPHTSPHAVASTLSMGLASHGPCIGAGVGTFDDPQAILTAATLVERPDVGGAWIVFSGWSHEHFSDARGGPACLAAVLAVVPHRLAAAKTIRSVGRITLRPAAHKPESIGPNRSPTTNLTEWLTAYGQAGQRSDGATHDFSAGEMSYSIELFEAAARRRAPRLAILSTHAPSYATSTVVPHGVRAARSVQPALEPS